jgi:tripartite-type tricarboxylate transporter receptor subunit TctC
MMRRRHLLALPLLAALPAPALGQAPWPQRPVRIVVPFPPGGTTDILGRALAAKWQEAWGQQVVVENRAGGGGVTGTEAVFRAAPDGLTLVLGNNQTHAMNGALIPGLPYEIGGFAAATLVARAPHALVVPATSPARTVAELIEIGRRPGRGLSYASSSAGSASHLLGDTFVRRNGLNATHIPYRGAAPAAQDLVAGVVDFSIATWAGVSALAADGRLRALAVGGDARYPELPDVPTFREVGQDDAGADAWFGVFAPPGTPPAVLDRVYAAAAAALSDATLRGRLEAIGFRIETMAPTPFAAFYQAEVTRWGAMVRAAGVTITN